MLINSFWSRLWLEQIYGWNIFMVGASMVGTFLQLEHVNSDWSSWRMVGADSWLEHTHGWSRSMVGAKRLWLVHPISRTIPDWLEQKCSTENLGWSKRSVGVNTQLDHAPTAYLLQLSVCSNPNFPPTRDDPIWFCAFLIRSPLIIFQTKYIKLAGHIATPRDSMGYNMFLNYRICEYNLWA